MAEDESSSSQLELLLSSDVPDDSNVTDMAFGEFANACHTVALQHGLFASLSNQAMTCADLAAQLNFDPKSLDHVLRVLVARGDLSLEAESYRTTKRTDAFWVESSLLYRGPESREQLPTGRVVDMVNQTLNEGLSPIGHDGRTYTDMWEHGDISGPAAAKFNRMMHANIFASAIAAVRSGALDSVQHLIDVGGGPGSFAIAFAAHNPNARATVMDLEAVNRDARRYIEQFGLETRIDGFAGNFFKGPWPTDGDAMLLSNILHDWTVDKGEKILRGVYEALPPGGRVFIHECLLEDCKTRPLATVVFDLLMQKNHGSQQYTQSELASLLADVGFTRPRIVHQYAYYSLVEATRPA